MSRIIDMTKPMNEWDPDDVRYALDRNMFDDETAYKAKEWLDGVDVSDGPPKPVSGFEQVDPDAAPAEPLYDPGDEHVEDVVKHLGTVDADEFARIIQAERDGKARKTILEMAPEPEA